MIYLPLYYLGPVSHYSRMYRALVSGEGFQYDAEDRWEKQTLRSRCYVAGSQGVMLLSVPVQHQSVDTLTEGALAEGTPRPKDTLTAHMLLSSHGNWRHQHWNALVSNYRQSPFFDYYADDFEQIYKSDSFSTLWEFNLALHEIVAAHLGFDELPPVGALDQRADFAIREYYQVFRNRTGFLSDLSVVDLLFNMGPESRLYL